jgi:hypothetical protein
MTIKWTSLDFSRHAVRDIWIDGIRIPAPEVISGEVYQCEYMHDAFIFQMIWPDVRALSSSSGWLVQMRWGAGTQQNTFYGYVQSASLVETRQGGPGQARITEFVCLGATSIMQSGSQRSFAGMSADNVAKSLLKPYRLALVADAHPFLWNQLVQVRETDWQFLVTLAKKVGYILTSDKVTVFFSDPFKIVQNLGYVVSIYAIDSTTMNPSLVFGRVTVGAKANVPEFTNTVVRDLDPMGTVVQGSGLYDQRLSYLGANPVVPTTERFDGGMTAMDAKHAQVIAASGNRPEKWPLQTSAFCKGNGWIRPGVIASLHVGANDIAGMWVTREAVHHLQRDSYTMDVKLARDATTNSPYPTPTILSGDRSGPLNGVAQSVVVNDHWTSVWSA